MEQFVGMSISSCIIDLLKCCETKPLVIEKSTSRKVLGTGEVRILRIEVTSDSVTCLAGVY